MEPEEKAVEVKEKRSKKAAEPGDGVQLAGPDWATFLRADAERRHIEHLAAVLMTGGWGPDKVASKIEAARAIAITIMAKGV